MAILWSLRLVFNTGRMLLIQRDRELLKKKKLIENPCSDFFRNHWDSFQKDGSCLFHWIWILTDFLRTFGRWFSKEQDHLVFYDLDFGKVFRIWIKNGFFGFGFLLLRRRYKDATGKPRFPSILLCIVEELLVNLKWLSRIPLRVKNRAPFSTGKLGGL